MVVKALRMAAVAAVLGSAGCYASHERPLDPVACAPFVMSSDGVITNATNARFAVDSALTLRSVAFAWRSSSVGPIERHVLDAVGELVNPTSSTVCADDDSAVLIVNGAATTFEVMGDPHLIGGLPATCVGAGESAVFGTSLEATSAFSRLESIARVSLTLDAIATSVAVPDPAAPTFGTPTWLPSPDAPGSFDVHVPVTSDGDPSTAFAVECALWSVRCGIAVRRQPAGWTTGDEYSAHSRVERDPRAETDEELRCYGVPFERF